MVIEIIRLMLIYIISSLYAFYIIKTVFDVIKNDQEIKKEREKLISQISKIDTYINYDDKSLLCFHSLSEEDVHYDFNNFSGIEIQYIDSRKNIYKIYATNINKTRKLYYEFVSTTNYKLFYKIYKRETFYIDVYLDTEIDRTNPHEVTKLLKELDTYFFQKSKRK